MCHWLLQGGRERASDRARANGASRSGLCLESLRQLQALYTMDLGECEASLALLENLGQLQTQQTLDLVL